jgi:hypothetical protein
VTVVKSDTEVGKTDLLDHKKGCANGGDVGVRARLLDLIFKGDDDVAVVAAKLLNAISEELTLLDVVSSEDVVVAVLTGPEGYDGATDLFCEIDYCLCVGNCLVTNLFYGGGKASLAVDGVCEGVNSKRANLEAGASEVTLDFFLAAHKILIHNEVYCGKGRNGGGAGEELLKGEGCGVLAAIAVEAVANVAKEYGIVEFYSGVLLIYFSLI